jgi:hypothetical protein
LNPIPADAEESPWSETAALTPRNTRSLGRACKRMETAAEPRNAATPPLIDFSPISSGTTMAFMAMPMATPP